MVVLNILSSHLLLNGAHFEVIMEHLLSVIDDIIIGVLFTNITQVKWLLWECDPRIESYEGWPASISILLTLLKGFR